MSQDHLDKRGNPKDGWYCTFCETKIDDKVMDSYPSTLSDILKQAQCHRCKKKKVIKLYRKGA